MWKHATVTDKGLALQAKLLDGKTLTITRAEAGAGKIEDDQLHAAEEITDKQQDLTLQPPHVLEGAKIRVSAQLSNTGVRAAYQMHQLGFFATDPDDGEILYAIAQDDTGDRIPSETDAPGFCAEWSYTFEFLNAQNVEITLNPAGNISAGMLGKPNGVGQLGDNGALPISQGGTGAITAQAARENLEIMSKEETTQKLEGKIDKTKPIEHALSLQAGWSGNAKYFKTQNGICVVTMDIVKNAQISGGENFATLPVGYRPMTAYTYVCGTYGPHGAATVAAQTTGVLNMGDMSGQEAVRNIYAQLVFLADDGG